MTTGRRRPAVVLAVAVALVVAVLAGCGDDASEGREEVTTREELVTVLRERDGMSAERARCVADRVFDHLSSDEIDALRRLDEGQEPPADLRARLRRAVTPCASVE